MESVIRKAGVTTLMVTAVVLTNEGYRAARTFYDQVQATSAEVMRLRDEVRELQLHVKSATARGPSPLSLPAAPMTSLPLPLPLPSPVGMPPRRAAVSDVTVEPAVVLASELKNAPAASTLSVKLLGDEK